MPCGAVMCASEQCACVGASQGALCQGGGGTTRGAIIVHDAAQWACVEAIGQSRHARRVRCGSAAAHTRAERQTAHGRVSCVVQDGLVPQGAHERLWQMVSTLRVVVVVIVVGAGLACAFDHPLTHLEATRRSGAVWVVSHHTLALNEILSLK